MLRFMSILIVCTFAWTAAVAQVAQTTPDAVASAWEFLPTYEFGQDRLALTTLDYIIRDAQGDAAQLAEIEQRLAAILSNPSATLEAKRWILRHLAHIGTASAVPAIADLLGTEGLTDHAIRALEANPAQEAGEALLNALGGSDDKAPIVRALGARGDASAADALETLLGDSLAYGDAAMATQVADALAEIGGNAADRVVALYGEGDEATKSALVNAMLVIAGQGDSADGTALYEDLLSDEQPGAVRRAAFEGLVRTDPEAATQFVVDTYQSDDPLHLEAALYVALRHPDLLLPQAMGVFDEMPEEVQAPLLANAGKIGYTDFGYYAADYATSDDEAVRAAALAALGSIGSAQEVPLLLDIAVNQSGEARRLARTSLSTLPGGADTNAALLTAAEQGGDTGEEALRALEQRRAETMADTLVAKFVTADESDMRQPAIEALAVIGNTAHIPDLLALLNDESISDATKRAISTTLARITERSQETAAPELVAALDSTADEAVRGQIIGLLANAQNDASLATLTRIAGTDSGAAQAAAVSTLAQWKDPAPREQLLEFAKNTQDEAARAAALEGFVRMTGQSGLSPEATVEQLRAALSVAQTPQERKQVLSGLSNVTSLSALAAIQELVDDDAVRAEAQTAAVKVANALGGAYPQEARATLEQYVDRPEEDPLRTQAVQALDRMNKSQGFVTAWELAGPYMIDNEDGGYLFTQSFEPETRPDAVIWRVLPSAGDPARPAGLIDLFSAIGGFERVAYVRSQVYSAAATDAILEVSSDDGVKIWLNGELVHQKMMLRAVDMAQDKIKVSLKEGWNDIVLGVYNLGSDWGASVRVTDADGQPLEGVLARIPE